MELQEKILRQLPLQRGSRLSQTNRTFRSVLGDHYKMLQLNNPKGFVVDVLRLLATKPETMDADVLMTLHYTMFLSVNTSAFDYDTQDKVAALRPELMVLLRVGVEPWARHIEDPVAQGRFLKRVAHVFRYADSSCSDVTKLRKVSIHCSGVAERLGLDEKIGKSILGLT